MKNCFASIYALSICIFTLRILTCAEPGRRMHREDEKQKKLRTTHRRQRKWKKSAEDSVRCGDNNNERSQHLNDTHTNHEPDHEHGMSMSVYIVHSFLMFGMSRSSQFFLWWNPTSPPLCPKQNRNDAFWRICQKRMKYRISFSASTHGPTRPRREKKTCAQSAFQFSPCASVPVPNVSVCHVFSILFPLHFFLSFFLSLLASSLFLSVSLTLCTRRSYTFSCSSSTSQHIICVIMITFEQFRRKSVK